MEKQKLAEMVLAKMKQKQQLLDRNRPHYQVLRLEALFQKQLNDTLKGQIQTLQAEMNQVKATQVELQNKLDEIDNTGKKAFPRIVILPEFIASENIQAEVKDFYRKTSNSFLRTQILRAKGYDFSKIIEKLFLENMTLIRQLENKIENNLQEDRKTANAKRLKVLKQDLRLRSIRQEQKQLKQTIQREQEEKKDLLRQYEIKKVNLNSRKDRLKYVEQEIIKFKQQIEEKYNPISYREHLKKVFDVEIKNEILQKNLHNASKKVDCATRCIKEYEKKLEKTSSLVVLGRTSDSPALRLGLIQKRLSKERENESLTKRNVMQRFNLNSGQKRNKSSLSSFETSQRKHNSISKINLQNLSQSDKKNFSAKTTDRSSRGRNLSSLSKNLF